MFYGRIISTIPLLLRKTYDKMTSPYNQPYQVNTNDIYEAMNSSNFQKKQVQDYKDFDMMKPISFGFSRLFNSPLFWILGTIVMGIFLVVSYALSVIPAVLLFNATDLMYGAITGNFFSDNIVFIIVFIITLVVLMLFISVFQGMFFKNSLKETRVMKQNAKFSFKDFFKNINWKNTILSVFIAWMVLSAYVIIFGTLMVLSMNLGNVVSIIVGIGMVLLAFPFGVWFTFAPYYMMDNKSTLLGACKLAWKDSMDNFFPILGSTILAGIIAAGILMITLGLGFFLTIPFQYLAYAHIYKQMSEGRVIPE